METLFFNNDYTNKKIGIKCILNAPLNVIWDAFTNHIIQEKWLGPEPYQVVTKDADFKEDGHWLYYMLSPKGEKYWSITHYKNIINNTSYEASDAFCDENGVVNPDFPQLNWQFHFSEKDGWVTVHVIITLTSEKEMKQLLEMGFEEGYRMSINQLQKLLKQK